MTRTFGTMFSGGGLADVGMIQAGWVPVFGIEFSEEIADVYRRNVHANILVADVRCVDYSRLDRPDHLHASPVCKNASVANSEGKESPVDVETAEAVCRAVRALRPDTFTLENVFGYRHFRAYHNILRALLECGYRIEQHHVNSADYGVPQTRKRLILRATLGKHLRPLQETHAERTPAAGLFDEYEPLASWIGWYAAIEDLIPTLPASQFAPWQLERLPQDLFGSCIVEGSAAGADNPFPLQAIPADMPVFTQRARQNNPRAFLLEGDAAGDRCPTIRDAQEPAFTLKAAEGGRVARAFLMPLQGENAEPRGQAPPALTITANHDAGKVRAFLVDGDGNRSRQPTVLADVDPSMTVQAWHGRRPIQAPRAFIVDGKPANFAGDLSVTGSAAPTPTLTASQDKHPFRAWLEQGRVVSMTPRALARFQSVPDWYELPTAKKLACTVIGNGIPSLLMQRIAESLND